MRSLKRALLVSILGGVSLVVVASGTAAFAIARDELRGQLDEDLLARARTFGALVIEDEGVLEFDYEGSLAEADLGVLVRISTEERRVVARSPEWPAEISRPAVDYAGDPVRSDVQVGEGSRARAVAVAMFAWVEMEDDFGAVREGLEASSDRLVVIEVIGRTDGVRRAEAALLAALAAGAVLTVAGSLIAVWLGVRRGLGPIGTLGTAVDRIDASELELPARGRPEPEELRPIVTALEGLLERLRGAMERERRFTDAAAHELRTPIAALKTITDVASRYPEPERLRRSVRDARVVVGQMEELLESLLTAARGEADGASDSGEAVDLLTLSRSASESAVERLGRSDLTWTFEGDEGAHWFGPPAAIAAVIRNVIDNAAEYTPANGSVRISASGNGDGASIEVENGPVSIEPGEVERLFEPFWRASAVRGDCRHQGLGLSIAQTLAGAMKIRREAVVTEEGRLRVRFVAGANGGAVNGRTAVKPM